MKRLLHCNSVNIGLILTVLVVNTCRISTAKRHRRSSILEDADYWNRLAQQELLDALTTTQNTGVAKNVIIFLGDGMGMSTVTASRIYKGQRRGGSRPDSGEEQFLVFERFPHVGLSKTYSVDRQVPDSASTATAAFCGVKGNYETVGLDSTATLGDCTSSLSQSSHVKSVLVWAQEAGKDTGFVTTTRVTHATPSALYAHSADRRWECDGKMPPGSTACKDIARQLVEDEPGKNIKVIMGGGRQCLKTQVTGTPTDPIDTWACRRQDNLDLAQTWLNNKSSAGFRPVLLQNNEDLAKFDAENADYVLGLFANGHVVYDYDRDKSPTGQPSLVNMTEAAIKMLNKSSNGFFLMVEGGRIDHGHHTGYARRALDETLAMEDAIVKTLEMVDVAETLIIVTSDHSHTMTINGYPKRGNDILGIAEISDVDFLPYTTLSYANGRGFNTTTNGTHVLREDVSKTDTTSFDYMQMATFPQQEETHEGSDVAVYAIGPMAHLFHRVHEQNYIAHVMGYAACIGPNTDHCTGTLLAQNPNKSYKIEAPFVILILILFSLHFVV